MQGETPNADRHAKILEAQRLAAANHPSHIAHLDDRGTDKYYRSKQVSALHGTAQPAQARVPQSNLANLDERSTNRYYKGANLAPTREQLARMASATASAAVRVAAPGGGARPVPLAQMAQPTQSAQMPAGTELRISAIGDIKPIMDAACSRVLNGTTPVIVEVAAGLGMAARTALDQRITREDISEDQGRDILLRVAQATAPVALVTPTIAATPAAQPAGTVAAPTMQQTAPASVDPLSASSAASVATGSADPLAAPAQEEDAASGDFLPAEPPPASEEMETKAETKAPAAEEPIKPSKRRGRGS